MGIRVTIQDSPHGRGVLQRLKGEGLTPHVWSNQPFHRYGWHEHAYPKVLYCVRGSIVFHSRDGEFRLKPGDRLDIDAGTEHAATVGPDGVECAEAARSPVR